jgi:hypothetical protein
MPSLDSIIAQTIGQENDRLNKAMILENTDEVVKLVEKETRAALKDEDKPETKWFNIVRDLIAGNFKEIYPDKKLDEKTFKAILKKVVTNLEGDFDFLDSSKVNEEALVKEVVSAPFVLKARELSAGLVEFRKFIRREGLDDKLKKELADMIYDLVEKLDDIS